KKNKKKKKEQIVEEPVIQKQVQLATFMDTVSYIIGWDLGQNLKIIHEDLKVEPLLEALTKSFSNEEGLFSQEVNDSIMQIFENQLLKKDEMNNATLITENKAAGSAFLAKNKEMEGVVELPSGLQYKILNEGSGNSPVASDKVTVHYKGMLLDGTVFDSSYDRGESISFPLNGVIPGWTEGLQIMKTGGKSILYIPPELGYGDRDIGPIPPGSTLIFEVELISIN
ncbi:MAG: FKBP-type peptidyl-prolyl cis-trans isomerase, partial [Bacteroidales bacterium]|nr:FKBP-type peptidyl-prolyl cis-trans isomerase [Bacteroidales bacterium]